MEVFVQVNIGRVIVASGEERPRRDWRSALEFDGHRVAEAKTAAQMLGQACSGLHHVLVMDSVMDGIAAHSLCREIRPKSEIGILVLDGAGSSAIDALNAGADDHVARPLAMEELVARVRAIIRRIGQSGKRRISLGDRTIDLDSHKIEGPNGRVIHLTPKEFKVFECLVAHAGKPRTHQYLAQAVWQRDGIGEVEYLRMVVNQLRRKLEPEPDHPRYILTERSIGYRFEMPLEGGL
jgi:two-component system, OmpR family, KDP operon response regulator KdpE